MGSDGVSVPHNWSCAFFCNSCKKIKVAIISYIQYNCHLLNLRATIVVIPCQKGGISMPPYINFCHLLANPFHFLATKLPPFKFICQLGNFACHRVAFDATLHLFLPPRGKFVPLLWHINATLHLFLPNCGNSVPPYWAKLWFFLIYFFLLFNSLKFNLTSS